LTATALFAAMLVQTAAAQPGYGQPGYDNNRDRQRQTYDQRGDQGRYGDQGRTDDRARNQPSYGYDDQRQSWRQRYQREYSYQDDNYYRQCRTKVDPAGVIAGALIGGLLGNAMAGRRGGRAAPTIAGVVIGGALGAALTKNLDCEDQSYAYNSYYNGFNSGRTNVPYQWRNPNSGNYGEVRVNNYFNDQAGFRCAQFNQQIYIHGRPQQGTGRACQQPDGTWAIVN
jgi:surface antigen